METGDIHILLVDDDPDDAFIISKMLKDSSRTGQNFLVSTAGTLHEGIAYLQKIPAQVIILDLSLPDSQGIDTFRQFYAAARHLPIIVCSGLSDEDVALKAIREGAQDYLMKGKIDQIQFQQVIRFALERFNVEKMRSEFVSMVVHELRSPLVVAGEFLDLTVKGTFGELNDEQSKYLQLVKKTLGRLNHVIDDLLDLTRLELGSIELKLSRFDLADLLRKTVLFYQEHANRLNLKLTLQAPERYDITGDEEKIEQLFVNLISNALKFTQKGTVEVELRDNDTHVHCIVRDTGPGISEEKIGKIFDKFRQFGRSKTEKGEKGSGLGLAICKGIVAAHQGDIRVESKVGDGSAFIVSLPKLQENPDDSASENPVKPA